MLPPFTAFPCLLSMCSRAANEKFRSSKLRNPVYGEVDVESCVVGGQMRKSSAVILRASFVALLLGVGPGQAAEVTHHLKPSPKTVTWGYFDPRTPSALRVRSGDTVEIETLV